MNYHGLQDEHCRHFNASTVVMSSNEAASPNTVISTKVNLA